MGVFQAFQGLHLNGPRHVQRSFTFGWISGLTTTLPPHLGKMNVVGREQRSTSQHKALLSLLASLADVAPTGFVLHNKTRALVVERLWPSSPFVWFVERTDPDNNAFEQKNWVLISLDACMFFVCLLWKPDTILRLDAIRATRNNYFAICSSWAPLSTLQTNNCKT